MTEQYFQKQFAFQELETLKQEQIILQPPPNLKLNLAYLILFNRSLKKLIAAYSYGVEIEKLLPMFEACISALTHYKEQPKARNIFFNKEVDEYMNALALVSWGLALGVKQTLLDELTGWIDSEGVRDALIDLLVASRRPDREISSALYFPKLYSSLYQAARNRSSEQVSHFLAKWYETCLRRTSSYDIHTLHGGEDSGFNGYWAWEVAGLTCALDLDDSLYRDMAYYPRDLVAYARR